MIKKAIHTAVLLAVLATAAACRQDEELEGTEDRPMPGFVRIEFRAESPEPDVQSIGTRAVDPDGGGIREMTLFCFDNYGFFISTVPALLYPTGDLNGKFTANVPEHTRRIHFVANQNMTDFSDAMFFNKSEAQTLSLMEGSAGQMIYWARFACPVYNPTTTPTPLTDELKKFLEENNGSIVMLRNHAKITVVDPDKNEYMKITGMAVYNGYVFGTVAPYSPEVGYNFSLEQWQAANFVTLPARDAKQTDVRAVTNNTHQYIFEHDNQLDDPISIILRGHELPEKEGETPQDLYYRVVLYNNTTGEFIPVRRNHDYRINIAGKLDFGQPTFEEALTAPATNNVWISISDNVKEVEDANYKLSVKETFIVRTDDDLASYRTMFVEYTLEAQDKTKTLTDAEVPSATWLDNTIAGKEITNGYTIEGNKCNGSFAFSPIAMGNSERLEGTLLIKYGNLQRKVKIIRIKRQNFTPSWISSGIYGGLEAADKDSRVHVSLLFTIPESCPAELFPMKVYITAPELDVRSSSGMALPVVRYGDTEWYPSDEYLETIDHYDGPKDADYKFVYTAQAPGPQRIYFENLLSHAETDKGEVHIEAPYFTTMNRTFSYDGQALAITVANAGKFDASKTGQAEEGDAKDEFIYFYRVPQRKGAGVELTVELRRKTGVDAEALGDLVPAQPKDEFFVYTQNLNNYVEMTGSEPGFGEYDPSKITPQCYFSRYTDEAAAWMGVHNPEGGRMLMFKPEYTEGAETNPGDDGILPIHLYTNRAKSAGLVRISSNRSDQVPVMPEDAGDGTDGTRYAGQTYRGFLLELANFNPFRFGARVKYDKNVGDNSVGEGKEPNRSAELEYNRFEHVDIPESVTDLKWDYEPNKRVEIAFDVTSFKALANDAFEKQTESYTSVSPFGAGESLGVGQDQPFEIYIDAPMLKIDVDRLAAYKLNGDKLKADPNVPGRFIYTVEGNREAERAFGMADALNVDDTGSVNQTGERKILPFIVKDITSAGDIVLSSNKDKVVFYDKTFRVTNNAITGNIVAEMAELDENGNPVLEPVTTDEFVAFERVTNNNRIGIVTITADGKFELRLRKEFPLDWTGYPVAFHYEHDVTLEDGTTHKHLHHAEFASLAAMYEALKDGNGTVVLKAETTKH